MNDDVTLQLEMETARMNSNTSTHESEENEGSNSVTCSNFLLKALYLLLDLQEVLLSTWRSFLGSLKQMYS